MQISFFLFPFSARWTFISHNQSKVWDELKVGQWAEAEYIESSENSCIFSKWWGNYLRKLSQWTRFYYIFLNIQFLVNVNLFVIFSFPSMFSWMHCNNRILCCLMKCQIALDHGQSHQFWQQPQSDMTQSIMKIIILIKK